MYSIISFLSFQVLHQCYASYANELIKSFIVSYVTNHDTYIYIKIILPKFWYKNFSFFLDVRKFA